MTETHYLTRSEALQALERVARRTNEVLAKEDSDQISIEQLVEAGKEAGFKAEDIRECAMEIYDKRNDVSSLKTKSIVLASVAKGASAVARWFIRNNTFNLYDCEGWNPFVDHEGDDSTELSIHVFSNALGVAVIDAGIVATACHYLTGNAATGLAIGAGYGAVSSYVGTAVGWKLRKLKEEHLQKGRQY